MANKTIPRKTLLEKAFDGIKIKDLADKLGTTRSYIYNIKYGFRRVSGIRAKELEKITKGKLSRKILRPDIFAD